MLRRLFARRKRRAPIVRSRIRLQLEQLEKREVLDAALVQGFNYLTLNAYQTAQQSQQLQSAMQGNLAQFQQNAAAYTAGKGVTLAQLNQNIAAAKQDASNIQALNSAFQTDMQYFMWGLAANMSNLSSNDMQMLFIDAYFLENAQSTIASAMQTAGQAASLAPPANPSTAGDPQLVTLTLKPLAINLLGLNVQTNQIQVNIAADQGNGDLLGNLLGDAANLLNLPALSTAVNNVLDNVVNLLNSSTLSVSGLNTSTGPFSNPQGNSTTSSTSVLTLQVAPVTLNLMGAEVTTSPIDLSITANAGQGLLLGNVVTDLANLFNPPLPNKLTLDDINGKLASLVNELNAQFPTIPNPQPVTLSSGQFLDLVVSPINLNLLSMMLQTSSIQVTAANQTGNGDLLGNIGTTLLNTVDATTANLTTFSNDLNDILGKVIGVLNASTLALPTGAVGLLPQALQELTSPTLVTSTVPSTAPILNLAIASQNGGTPVNVNLLGLQIATSNIQAQITAQTGDGQILGNLLFNLANLLNPGGAAGLLPILGELGL